MAQSQLHCSLSAGGTPTPKPSKWAWCCPIRVPIPISAIKSTRRYDLYVKLHAKDLGDNKIELIKRDEGPASGANARTVVTELITNDKVKLLAGFVFSPSAIAAAPLATQAKMPMLISNAGTAWITNLSPYIVRFSFSMWDPAYPMGTYAATKFGCKTAAGGFTDFPPGQDSTLAFKTAFEKAGGKVVDEVRMGSPGPVPDFTPFFQRVKDEHPDCFYVFVPSGSHAGGVMKTYGDLGMRQAGIRLIGPMDLIPDYQLAHMSDAAIGLVVDLKLFRRLRHADQQGLRQGMARRLWTGFLSRFRCRLRAWTRWRRSFTSSTRCTAISMTAPR